MVSGEEGRPVQELALGGRGNCVRIAHLFHYLGNGLCVFVYFCCSQMQAKHWILVFVVFLLSYSVCGVLFDLQDLVDQTVAVLQRPFPQTPSP